ncbi:NAD kinase, partial [Kipferlia bialata]|eukprot:g14450.t1
MSAGGSPIHPSVPALLFTPICPHVLSFRPIVLPDATIVRITVPAGARATAWASFDGRCRVELCENDSVVMRMSKYALPTINQVDQSIDWFASMKRCLNWNVRTLQIPFG